ncbi:hypothetical protein [Aquimonas sp.]|uniref:hypothetical protein n=1 Tax=Aquimonas sp. TaxID=1872588 RepID=UPI0037C139CA
MKSESHLSVFNNDPILRVAHAKQRAGMRMLWFSVSASLAALIAMLVAGAFLQNFNALFPMVPVSALTASLVIALLGWNRCRVANRMIVDRCEELLRDHQDGSDG